MSGRRRIEEEEVEELMELGNGPRARTTAEPKQASQHQKQNQSLPAMETRPGHAMDGCQDHRKPRAKLQQRQQVSPSPPSNPAPPLHLLREVLHGPARDGML